MSNINTEAESKHARGYFNARLETALRASRLGTYEWNTSTGDVEVDLRAREIHDLPKEGAVRESDILARMEPAHVERVRAEAMAAVGLGVEFDPENLNRTIDITYEIIYSDGSRHYIDSCGKVIQDPDGTRRMIGTFNDVTLLKRAQALLLEKNISLEQRVVERTTERDRIWRNSRDMLGVANEQGVWLSVSPAWSRVLGWDLQDIIGRSSEWMEHPDDHLKTQAEIENLTASNITSEFDNRLRTKGGEYRHLSWTVAPEEGLLYCVARDVTEERTQTGILSERSEQLRLYENIVHASAAPICAFDTELKLIAFSQSHSDEFHRIFSYRVKLGDVFPDLFPPDQASIIRGFMERALTGEAYTVTEEFGDPNLAKPYWEVSYSPLRDAGGKIIGAFHYAKDISERLRAADNLAKAQEALRQSQKMEAVGQLTGGLAHDFNNLLAGISGSLELMQTRLQQGRFQDVERYLTVAQGAARRAAALTHRLLAFSRRQTLDPKPTDVNSLVTGMQEMIQRTVGPAIPVEVVGASDLWTALVDASQLENSLLNLCINARDAMPDGGRITIETANKWFDERTARQQDIPEGQYLSMCVTDTGTGMPPEVVGRVFEPFFTTKPIGEGTGLGLSMIYGFAKQSGGQVRIYSEVGRGTTVCIYMPRYHGDVVDEKYAAKLEALTHDDRGASVLVVDDEPTVRILLMDILDELGYSSMEASDSAAGLKILQSDVPLDLLITDIGLPGGMNGRQMADAARVKRPDLKVLFITGYAENSVLGNGRLAPGMAVLTKPFSMGTMAARIRSLLESVKELKGELPQKH